MTAGPPVGSYDYYSVTLSAPACSVRRLRRGREPRAIISAATRMVLSSAADQAIQYDIIQSARHDALVLIPLVLVVIFVVVALLLQAVVGASAACRHDRDQFRGLVRAVQPAVARARVIRHRSPDPAVRLHLPGRARGGLQHLPHRAHPGGIPAGRHPARDPARARRDRRRYHRRRPGHGRYLRATSPGSPTSRSPRSGSRSRSASCSTPCSSAPCSSRRPARDRKARLVAGPIGITG